MAWDLEVGQILFCYCGTDIGVESSSYHVNNAELTFAITPRFYKDDDLPIQVPTCLRRNLCQVLLTCHLKAVDAHRMSG